MSDEDVKVDAVGTLRGLALLKAGVSQAVSLTIRAAVKAAEESAKASPLFRDRSGGTRASIHGEVFGTTGRLVAGGASRFLQNGTVPHLIVAKNARALRFVVNGTIVFRKWVRHPGTKPRPFLSIAREVGLQTAQYGAEYYLNYAIQRAR